MPGSFQTQDFALKFLHPGDEHIDTLIPLLIRSR